MFFSPDSYETKLKSTNIVKFVSKDLVESIKRSVTAGVSCRENSIAVWVFGLQTRYGDHCFKKVNANMKAKLEYKFFLAFFNNNNLSTKKVHFNTVLRKL